MRDVVIVLIVFSSPLSFILGRTFLKYKALQLEAGKHFDPNAELRLMKLEKENESLRARVETLETIATGEDPRMAGLQAAHKLKELEHVVTAQHAFAHK